MRQKLGRLSLVRHIYRALLNNGRTYAAFEREQVFPFVERLACREEILDPMAGYGTLMGFCSEVGPRAWCIEGNPPMYLWEILVHPAYAEKILKIMGELDQARRKWPRTGLRASASDDWFPEESKRLISELFALTCKVGTSVSLKKREAIELPLALLLPFTGRLSCSVPGNVVTHVKMGGICVYEGWREDFARYIEVLSNMLRDNLALSKNNQHSVTLGDCRTLQLPRERFSAMMTSPPYPNSRDYSAMFRPENELLSWLERKGDISGYALHGRLIGSVHVGEKTGLSKRKPQDIKTNAARKFVHALENFRGTRGAEYDNRVYYIPYFTNYFCDLERAYQNIAPSLARDVEAYIIVVDNTARNHVVPVAEAILEVWRSLGFKADVVHELTREVSHVGGINPRVKGFKARHTERTLKIWRR